MTNRKEKLGYIFFSLLAGFFLFFPVYSAFIKGVFRWHISQKILWKDALELLVYICMIVILSVFAKNKKGIIVLIAGVTYLMSTGTLQECIVSYAYIEILLLIGRSFLNVFSKDKKSYSAGISFLAGSLIWGTLAIMMSLLQHGTINELRMLTLVLLLLAVINPKDKSTYDDILLIKYIKYLNRNDKKEFIVNLFFVLIMMLSCARVNKCIEFDSSWYALYTDKCLFGEKSFYEFLGYTEFVYYYPKFKELLMAPISGLGMEGYLISSNLWIMLICAVEVYEFLKENIVGSKFQILCVVYLIFSSVCIVGISGTAKSDTISYLYMVLLVIYITKFLKTREQTLLWIAVSSGIMSYTVKYTSYLWSTIIFFIAFVTMIYLVVTKKTKIAVPDKLSTVLVAFACVIFLGVIYRTFKLTGYPTYRAGKRVWDTLGFSARPYFNNEGSSIKVFELSRIYSAFFDVNNAGKIVAQWTGNYTLFYGLSFLFLCKKKQKTIHGFMLITAAALATVSLYYLVTLRAPDANYFGIGLIIITCYIFIRMTECKFWQEAEWLKKWFTIVTGGFMLLNLLFVFITHPSWETGTRFSGEQISLYVSETAKLANREKLMKLRGIYEINEKLKNTTDGKAFLLVDGSSDMCILDARCEIVSGVFSRHLSAANMDDYQDFLEYIDYVEVDGFIIAQDESGHVVFDDYVKQYVAENGCIDQVDTDKYSYYKIR